MDVGTLNIDGKKYIRLYVAPTTGRCMNTVPERTFWQHANSCHGNIYVGDDALCYCDKCHARSHIRNWQLKYDSTSSADYNHDDENRDNRLSVAKCTAIAGEMVKEGSISWLKSFLEGLSSYILDQEMNLVMEPYSENISEHLEDHDEEDTDSVEVSDNFEVSTEELTEQPETPELLDTPAKPEEDSEDNCNLDLSSFDESTFFERLAKNNNQ